MIARRNIENDMRVLKRIHIDIVGFLMLHQQSVCKKKSKPEQQNVDLT